MKIKKQCTDCKWCSAVELNADNIGTKNYVCCYNPPQLTHIPVGGANGNMGIMVQSGYPVISVKNLACSKFEISTAVISN